MEVWEQYGRTRAIIRGRVCAANLTLAMCRKCLRVSGRALAHVPVSYPRRVVRSQNAQRHVGALVASLRLPPVATACSVEATDLRALAVLSLTSTPFRAGGQSGRGSAPRAQQRMGC
jgi:hypothetical protein